MKPTDEQVRVAIEAYGAETGGILWQSGMTAALEAAFAMLPEPACGCREALEKLADLDVPRPIGKSWRADGSESKHDECVHGVYMYADCPECIAEFVRAALAKPQGCGVRENWRLIETAPKDGTPVLAFAADPVAKGRHYFGVAQWAEKQDWSPRSVEGWFWSFAIRPTHWMPLPTAPAHKETK